MTTEIKNEIDSISLDVISYHEFINDDIDAIIKLKNALFEKGIVGIKGIPGYVEKVKNFIKSAREFTSLSDEVKDQYAPNHEKGDMFLGYESGKERFKAPDGQWIVDDLKTSYYAFIPNKKENKWPSEVDLKTPFQDLGALMSDMGEFVMKKIGLVGQETGVFRDGLHNVGRMLYYRKDRETTSKNPLWCGAHFDHGLFTTLIPASYFCDGEQISEPPEAGLFVKSHLENQFKKVIADDPEILLFQVGEFGQIVTNDKIRATEHKVQKANDNIERYALAVFFEAPMDFVVHSVSELTKDQRYGGKAGDPCSYKMWQERSFQRYHVKEEILN